MNINVELFKRYKPAKKLEIIGNLTQSELLSVTGATILRIIKEAGTGDSRKTRCKFKHLTLLGKKGNGRNSQIDNIYNWKKDEIFLDVYIQGDDTDTTVSCTWKEFADFRYDEVCLGKLKESFRNGYEHTIPANYDKEDRAEVIKDILYTYVHRKYDLS